MFEDNETLRIYTDEIKRYSPLTSSEEIALAKKIKKGNKKATDQLIKANLRFVIKVAQSYKNQGVALADLIQAGNEGLVKAATRFDGDKNFKFISFAVWYIRQAILLLLADQSRIYRVPTNQIHKLSNFRRCVDERMIETQREVSYEEALKIARDQGYSERDAELMIELHSRSISIDKPVTEDGQDMKNLLEDTNNSLADKIHQIDASSTVKKLLSDLPFKDRKIIELCFGLTDESSEEGLTLNEVGASIGITRERVRQIRERALGKIREKIMESAA